MSCLQARFNNIVRISAILIILIFCSNYVEPSASSSGKVVESGSKMKVAIIGAGCSGLVSAKYCLENDLECDVFEQTGNIGGIWYYTDRVGSDENGVPIHTVMYKDLRTNLPKEVMNFLNFPHRNQTKSYITQAEILEYMHEYADAFDLKRHIQFYKQVVNVEPLPKDRWKITVKDAKTKTLQIFEYDAVMICNGHSYKPFMPVIPGMDTFKGKQIHSNIYRNPDAFADLKVLVIGGGPSGWDIVSKITDVAKKVIFSHRSKMPMVIPNTTVVKPVVKKIDGYEITFEDGSKEIVDSIIYCTGYQYSFPFLSDECGITVDNKWVKYVYKHIINIEKPTMGFIGLCIVICPFPLGDIQARFFIASLKSKFQLPTKAEMLQDIKLDLGPIINNQPSPHFVGLTQSQYSKSLANIGQIKDIPSSVSNLFKYVMESGDFFRGEKCYKTQNDEDFEIITCSD